MRELSLNVLDVAQNSVSAGAGLVSISVAEEAGALEIAITDNGRGMTPGQLERVTDPFYTTRLTRDVGLGVPFFKMAAEQTGGSFSVESRPGEGTAVRARFCTGHIDMTPLGDMAETILALVAMNPDMDFVYTRSLNGGSFTLDTRELRQVLEGVPFSDPEVATWIRGWLNENEHNLKLKISKEDTK
jgi:anti-sigma regulatory factor (Ser/Thr protein kinase)